MRSAMKAVLVVVLGIAGVPHAEALPTGVCGLRLDDSPKNTEETCGYPAGGITGTLRLTVSAGQAKAKVTCTYGTATLNEGPGVYATNFTRVGLCTLVLTALADHTTATGASA